MKDTDKTVSSSSGDFEKGKKMNVVESEDSTEKKREEEAQFREDMKKGMGDLTWKFLPFGYVS